MSNLVQQLRDHRKNSTDIRHEMNLFDKAADKIMELEERIEKAEAENLYNLAFIKATDAENKRLRKRIAELIEHRKFMNGEFDRMENAWRDELQKKYQDAPHPSLLATLNEKVKIAEARLEAVEARLEGEQPRTRLDGIVNYLEDMLK